MAPDRVFDGDVSKVTQPSRLAHHHGRYLPKRRHLDRRPASIARIRDFAKRAASGMTDGDDDTVSAEGPARWREGCAVPTTFTRAPGMRFRGSSRR
jgi:hypothetical protein